MQNGWRESSLHAYILWHHSTQSCDFLTLSQWGELCFNLELPGNPPHCVSSVVSFSTNNPFSTPISVPPSKQSPGTLPTAACWQLDLADTGSFRRNSLCELHLPAPTRRILPIIHWGCLLLLHFIHTPFKHQHFRRNGLFFYSVLLWHSFLSLELSGE